MIFFGLIFLQLFIHSAACSALTRAFVRLKLRGNWQSCPGAVSLVKHRPTDCQSALSLALTLSLNFDTCSSQTDREIQVFTASAVFDCETAHIVSVLAPFGGVPAFKPLKEAFTSLAGEVSATRKQQHRLAAFEFGLAAGNPRLVLGIMETFRKSVGWKFVAEIVSNFSRVVPENRMTKFSEVAFINTETLPQSADLEELIDALNFLEDISESRNLFSGKDELLIYALAGRVDLFFARLKKFPIDAVSVSVGAEGLALFFFPHAVSEIADICPQIFPSFSASSRCLLVEDVNGAVSVFTDAFGVCAEREPGNLFLIQAKERVLSGLMSLHEKSLPEISSEKFRRFEALSDVSLVV